MSPRARDVAVRAGLGKRRGRQAPGGAAACAVAPATGAPELLPRCLKRKRRSELRFVFIRLIVGSEIAAVGRADLRHVVIVCPLHHRRRRGVRCLALAFRFFASCGSYSAPLTKNFAADTQTLRYPVAP
jgi:hypothetical protein